MVLIAERMALSAIAAWTFFCEKIPSLVRILSLLEEVENIKAQVDMYLSQKWGSNIKRWKTLCEEIDEEIKSFLVCQIIEDSNHSMAVLGIRGDCRSPDERMPSGETRFETIMQHVQEVKNKVFNMSKNDLSDFFVIFCVSS